MKEDKVFAAVVLTFSVCVLAAAFYVTNRGHSEIRRQAEVAGEVKAPAEQETEETAGLPADEGEEQTAQDRIRICLDPGHGGSDGGAEGYGYVEKEQTLELCFLIRDYLLRYDVDVVMTREEDVEVVKLRRPFFANEQGADVLVSIHRNNFARSSAYGFEIWIGKADNEEDRRLAQLIMDNIMTVPGGYNRGIITGSTTDRSEDYYINRYSLMPSCLIEMGFISNRSDNRLLEENKEEYAGLIAKAILTYFDIDLGEEINGKN
ncbi:MAG: N-acetylmuramoyl-L-alanine amidase [Alistipes sp.]|nr:N-acetylmuramoyl-L-alanine amidase [Alistipes sp.]